jgi:Flp pilus assembly protein TadG
MVSPVLLLLLFGMLDFGRLFFVQVNVQNAVQEAGRYASTGNHLSDPNNPGQNLSRVNSIVDLAETAHLLGGTVTSCQVSSLAGGSGSAGGPGDTVTVSMTVSLPLWTPFIGNFFPSGKYTFTSSATFKNEPFPSSQTT